MVHGLLLARSNAPLVNAQSLFNNDSEDTFELEGRTIRHYGAIPDSSKGLESHVYLCECSVSEEGHRDTLEDARCVTCHNAEATGPHMECSNAVLDAYTVVHSPSTSESVPALEDISQQNERDTSLIAWTDDDVDATDFKNMPDYDPNQEDSEYESTPEPEEIPSMSPTEPDSATASAEPLCVQRYVKLQSRQGSSVPNMSGRKLFISQFCVSPCVSVEV